MSSFGCAPSHDGPPARTERGAPPPDDPLSRAVEKVCNHPCAGSLAQIAVFRDAANAVGRLRFDGDLEACSHPPRIYFDADGNETFAIPFEPIVAGSPEAKALADQQDAQTRGLTESETLRCPGATSK